jgi:hypothetical protein
MTSSAALLLLAAAMQEPAGTDFFESRIRPLLVEHCVSCHGPKKAKGGLRLDTRDGWRKGGDSGPALVSGKPDSSLLIRMIRGGSESPPEMPPERRLPDSAVADLVRWIELGAPDPRQGEIAVAKGVDWTAAAEHWAFRPLASVEGAVDGFIDAGLASQGLAPGPAADRWTLIRRATFGLTGLPPSEDEVRAFLDDPSPDAFGKVVERLLAAPAYGEHQARHWLDLARFAEDQAHVSDGRMSHAWRYRDWVTEAFNRDLSYPRFVKLQLAADLMEGPEGDPADRRALGLLGLGAVYARPNDLARAKADQWDDRVDVLTRTFLGLTVSCARCHDHKYDPIPTADYYSLAGVIASTKDAVLWAAPRAEVAAYEAAAAKAAAEAAKAAERLQAETDRRARGRAEGLAALAVEAWTKPPNPSTKVLHDWLRKGSGRPGAIEPWPAPERAPELARLLQDAVLAELRKPVKQRNADLMKSMFGEKGIFPLPEMAVVEAAPEDWRTDYAALQAAAQAAAARVPPEPARCHGAAEAEKPSDLKVFVRGNPHRTGESAPRRFLRALAGPDPARFAAGSGRLELAEAIASHPLAARVMANRIWQQHFGRGIVATPSNFGLLGERPTHPALLERLAGRLAATGSIKDLHRAILASAAYRRSSVADAKTEATDPENRWLARMGRRRLRVEELRDALLAASGSLDLRRGGPSGDADDPAFTRRALYGKVSRLDLPVLFRLFDFPDPGLSSERRTETMLPQQSLFLMNSPFALARAGELAARLADAPDAGTLVDRAYRLVLARPPTPRERELGTSYLDGGAGRRTAYAQALLAGSAVLFVD